MDLDALQVNARLDGTVDGAARRPHARRSWTSPSRQPATRRRSSTVDPGRAGRRSTVLDDEDAVRSPRPRAAAERPARACSPATSTPCRPGATLPGRTRATAPIVGRGTADMKGGARRDGGARRTTLGERRARSAPVDVGLLFFGREELPITRERAAAAVRALPARSATIDLAIVMEPTANALEVGCLGNLNADVIVRGRAAHSARPWLGENAIHAAIDGSRDRAACRAATSTIDGLTFREVVNVTTIEGGSPRNVVPDRSGRTVNFRTRPARARRGGRGRAAGDAARARPRSRDRRQRAARPRRREQPAGRAAARPPAICRSAPSRRGPRSPSSALVGVDAVNFGPG